jgi:hypothetical protein
MKYKYLGIVLLALASCRSGNKKDQSAESPNDLHDQEVEYLKMRDRYKIQIAPRQSDTTLTFAELDTIQQKALNDMEKHLRPILKNARFSGKGKINLETFFGAFGLDRLDGLIFGKDSCSIFYSSEKLCFDMFRNRKITRFDAMSPEDFAAMFTRTYEDEAYVSSVSFIKIPSGDDVQAYGMLGVVTQGEGPAAPENTYVLVSKGGFVYMAAVRNSIPEIPSCNDTFYNELQDTTLGKMPHSDSVAWANYRSCLEKELKRDGRYRVFQKQVENIVRFINP